MAEKTKFIPKLKTKFKDLGFSEKAFDGVGTYLAGTVADDASDEDIDNAIGGVEPLLRSFQAEVDSRATAAATAAAEKAKKEATTKPTGGSDPAEPGKSKDDDEKVPAWAQKLAGDIASLKSEKAAQSHQERIMNTLKDKKVPESYYKNIIAGRSFKDEAEVDALASTIETGWGEFQQELSNQGLGQQSRPFTGQGGNDDKPASKEEVAGVVDQIM